MATANIDINHPHEEHPLFLDATHTEQLALKKYIARPTKENWNALVKVSREQKKQCLHLQQQQQRHNGSATPATSDIKNNAGVETTADIPVSIEMNERDDNLLGADSTIISISVPLDCVLEPTQEEQKVMTSVQFSLFDIEMMDDDELASGLQK